MTSSSLCRQEDEEKGARRKQMLCVIGNLCVARNKFNVMTPSWSRSTDSSLKEKDLYKRLNISERGPLQWALIFLWEHSHEHGLASSAQFPPYGLANAQLIQQVQPTRILHPILTQRVGLKSCIVILLPLPLEDHHFSRLIHGTDGETN